MREADGTEMYREEDYQHNRKYRDMRDTAGKIVETVMAALEEELGTVRGTLADLKAKLYGRFGKNINLEE